MSEMEEENQRWRADFKSQLKEFCKRMNEKIMRDLEDNREDFLDWCSRNCDSHPEVPTSYDCLAAAPEVRQQVSKETKHFVPGALDYPEDRTKCSVTTPVAVQASQQVTPNCGKAKRNQVVQISSRLKSGIKNSAQDAGNITECIASRATLAKEPQDVRMKEPMLKFEKSSQHSPSGQGYCHLKHVDIPDNMDDDRPETDERSSGEASTIANGDVGSPANALQDSAVTMANYRGVSAEGPGISPRVVGNLTTQTSGGLSGQSKRSLCDGAAVNSLDKQREETSVPLPLVTDVTQLGMVCQLASSDLRGAGPVATYETSQKSASQHDLQDEGCSSTAASGDLGLEPVGTDWQPLPKQTLPLLANSCRELQVLKWSDVSDVTTVKPTDHDTGLSSTSETENM